MLGRDCRLRIEKRALSTVAVAIKASVSRKGLRETCNAGLALERDRLGDTVQFAPASSPCSQDISRARCQRLARSCGSGGPLPWPASNWRGRRWPGP